MLFPEVHQLPALAHSLRARWRKRWNEGSLRYSPDETYANAPAKWKGLIYASVRITSRPVTSKNTMLGVYTIFSARHHLSA